MLNKLLGGFMINYIFCGLLMVGLGFLILFGSNSELNNVLYDSINESFKAFLGMVPLTIIWFGILKIAEDSGFMKKISRFIKPFLKKLFPKLKNSKALDYISLNVACNMLGLGSAATPFGLKAMEELEVENNNKKVASSEMITFLVLNTSGVTIIPSTIIAYRVMFHSVSPNAIIITSLFATFCSSLFGLLLDYLIRKKNG